MKVVILAGGYGTRITEETQYKPKPMIEIGGKPILWHIMKYYSSFGFNDFIICCGYKGEVIKNYFLNYQSINSDIEIDYENNKINFLKPTEEKWKIKLIDTGENTMTGGRLKRIKKYLNEDDLFFFTYGDGLSNINLKRLLEYHKKNKNLVTVTAVYTQGRFGALNIKSNRVIKFNEKPKGDNFRINGGFFVINKKALDFISGDKTVWEKKPLEILAKQRLLGAFNHNNFWYPMDTLRDYKFLQELWEQKKAPWKIW